MVTDEKKINARNEIIDIARKKFVQNGYAKTSMRQIARDANVSLALLPYHFKTKDALATEIMLIHINAMREKIVDYIASDANEFSKFVSITWMSLNIFYRDEKTLNFYVELLKDDVLNKQLIQYTTWIERLKRVAPNTVSENKIKIAITLANATERSLFVNRLRDIIEIDTEEILQRFFEEFRCVLEVGASEMYKEIEIAKLIEKNMLRDQPSLFNILG